MISTSQQFSVLIDELAGATWTLAAIGWMFDCGLADQLGQARTLDELADRCPGLSGDRIARCLAVATARGLVAVEGDRYRLAPGVISSLEPGSRAVLRGDYRSALYQAAAYLRAAGEPASAGWHHTDPLILQAQGDGSSMFATGLKLRLAQQLGDLGARLGRPGARFLDVGVGVAALSIAMCREFPALSAVGLDPYEVPLALARSNVTAAGLHDRIELRPITVHQLRDEAAFDLAWLPHFFLGRREAVAEGLARIRAALRPGGWVLVPALNPAAGAAQRAVWSLVLESWGGPALQAAEVEPLVAEAGLAPRVIPGPSWITMVAGQRPESQP
jgi:2-polyprenyl-3-methyl-5-hydroxy-6-metoxy-1,4-benzoquinol methylase